MEQQNNRTMEKGVSLIELLISVAIVFILLGASFIGYRQKGDELELQSIALIVMADIERAREMTMSGREFNGIIPDGGYGVYFNTINPNQYILFADIDSNKLRNANGSEDVELISLEEGVKLKTFFPASPAIAVFSPPLPIVHLQGGAAHNEISIIIALRGNILQTRTITVNRIGLVFISN